MPLPFDGAISRFFDKEAPAELRREIEKARKGHPISSTYPYDEKMDRKTYERDLENLQIELVKLQTWVRDSGARVCVVFEGRDAAGKGGTIKRFREFLNPRVARVVALGKPTDREAREWYFQRYIENLPAEGEIVFFDRSWYNRGVVEHVFEFCAPAQREKFFGQTPEFERLLIDEGIHLVKIWLTVGRAEQLSRLMARESDPLKQWKISWIDVEGLKRWSAYSSAIAETFERTHTAQAPWTIIHSDDKRRARLSAIRQLLSGVAYDNKNNTVVGTPDPLICGGPELWPHSGMAQDTTTPDA